MDLSVVIVTWNRKTILRDCLGSVREHTRGLDYEVIVVDNGSCDGTAEMVQGEFPGVRLIVNEENLGFSRGNNLGIRESRGRAIAVMNNDTLLRENALGELVSFLDSHPEAGVVGPRLLYPDGSIQESAMGAFIDIKIALLGGQHVSRLAGRLLGSRPSFLPEMVLPAGEQQVPRRVAWLVGACILFRREAWDQAGPFDEKIFMYAEDMEWCYRVLQAGWSVFFCPQVRVVHLDHIPTKAAMSRVVDQQLANQIYFYRKHKGRIPALCLEAALFAGTLLKLPGFALGWLYCRVSGRQVGRTLAFKLKFYLHAQRFFLVRPFAAAARWGRRSAPETGGQE